MLGVLSGLQGWHGLQYCNAMEYGRATMQAGLVEQVTSVTHVQAAHLSLRETLRGSTKGAAFDGCAASSWLALSPQGLLSLAGASVPTAFFSRSRTAGTTSGSLRKSPGSLSVSKLSAHERELLFGISGSLSLRSGEAALPRLALGPSGIPNPQARSVRALAPWVDPGQTCVFTGRLRHQVLVKRRS